MNINRLIIDWVLILELNNVFMIIDKWIRDIVIISNW